jgi:hypothetical protein
MMMMEEGAPLMEDQPEDQKKKNLEELTADEEGCLCCCCICHCSVEETRQLGCCGCFPIKCGVVTIGILTIALFFAIFIEIFYLLLNDQFAWWYVLVAVILLAPFFIGCCFFISYYAEDTDDSRSRLFVSCQFVIYSSCLVGIWNLIYLLCWYKAENVSIGSPDQGYYTQTKKSYIVWSMYLATAISFTWAYFLCVCRNYSQALKSEEKKAEEKKQARIDYKNSFKYKIRMQQKKAMKLGDLAKAGKDDKKDDKKDEEPAAME